MATTVDQLIVEIRAETKQLRKGLDEANRQLANTGKAAKRSLIPLGSFTKMFAAIGAIAGLRAVTNVSRQFEFTTFKPLHIGQPVPLDLLFILLIHSWSSPRGHFHHTFFLLPRVTSLGVKLPFKEECHCLAISG